MADTPNSALMNQFTLAQASNILSVELGFNATRPVSIQMAIYSDTGSNYPGNQIYLSPFVFYPAPTGYFVHTHNLAPSISLGPGNYWVGFLYNAAAGSPTEEVYQDSALANRYLMAPTSPFVQPFIGGGAWFFGDGISVRWNLCY